MVLYNELLVLFIQLPCHLSRQHAISTLILFFYLRVRFVLRTLARFISFVCHAFVGSGQHFCPLCVSVASVRWFNVLLSCAVSVSYFVNRFRVLFVFAVSVRCFRELCLCVVSGCCCHALLLCDGFVRCYRAYIS